MSVLTDEGRKTMKMRPERIQEVNKEMEKMGVKVITQYA
ncbi:MAG: GYD domain-containing protein, partial [Thermodesulfobacteriota bacterium]